MLQWLKTLDGREIYNQVINHLPDLELLTSDNFQVHTPLNTLCSYRYTSTIVLIKKYTLLYFFPPEETGPSSLVGQFYVRRQKLCLQRVQEATSFPQKRPHTGTLPTCLSLCLYVQLSVCLSDCLSVCLSPGWQSGLSIRL